MSQLNLIHLVVLDRLRFCCWLVSIKTASLDGSIGRIPHVIFNIIKILFNLALGRISASRTFRLFVHDFF